MAVGLLTTTAGVVGANMLMETATKYQEKKAEAEKWSSTNEAEENKNQPYTTLKVGLITAGIVASLFLLNNSKK